MLSLSRRFAIAGTAGLAGVLAARGAVAQEVESTEDAMTILKADPKFSDWVQVVEFAGLAQYAANNPPYTAFIPTNEAFKQYPEILAEALRSKSRAFPETATQVNFVRSHVIRDRHPLSESAGKISRLTSVADTPLTIDGTHSGYFMVSWVTMDQVLATARITGTAIHASNAIIYSYDNPVRA